MNASQTSLPAPLAGIRVLSVEQMQALPYATQLLARLGADVVKVEHPTRGDLGRGSMPGIPDSEGRHVGATYLRNNCGKRGIGLDMKNPAAKEIFLDLVPKFDIVAENFKPGNMDRFGLGYEAVKAVHEQVIYLSISGFGNTVDSPYQHWPAYASIAESMSGMYTSNRRPGSEVKVSPAGSLGDTGSGMFAVIGLLAALRQRDQSGVGAYLDISMFDCMVAFADNVPNFWSMGKDPGTPTDIILHTFPIEKGEITIQVGRIPHFETFARFIGHEDWLTDERFAHPSGWVEHIEVIRAAVKEWAGDRSSVEVADLLASGGVAAAPLFVAEDIVHDPHVRARNMLVEIPRNDGVEQPVLTPGNPIKLESVPDDTTAKVPELGEHTDEVLAQELGLSETDLAELRASGAIG